VRDLSTIETPPEERLPIQTTIGEYDETLIRQAILREIDRGGQVFFVHNRVQGISQIARRLERLIPEATYGIGHGQMPERELERVMLAFAEGQFNVLVCTTIIESGLDIPNANTIIINRADKFGLAQLYQLRGRVGRAAVRALCLSALRSSPGADDCRTRAADRAARGQRAGRGLFASPCAIWRSAALASCWGASSLATSRPWVSISTAAAGPVGGGDEEGREEGTGGAARGLGTGGRGTGGWGTGKATARLAQPWARSGQRSAVSVPIRWATTIHWRRR
jgi:hypothetical protein